MKRFSSRTGHSTMAELNITPLLDLAFVLLIIFIITTPALEQSMKLPIASLSGPADMAGVKMVEMDASGSILVDTHKVDPTALETELVRLRMENPKVQLGIRADANLPYQKIINIIDAAKRAGITQVGLVNTPEKNK